MKKIAATILPEYLGGLQLANYIFFIMNTSMQADGSPDVKPKLLSMDICSFKGISLKASGKPGG